MQEILKNMSLTGYAKQHKKVKIKKTPPKLKGGRNWGKSLSQKLFVVYLYDTEM